MKIFDTSGQLQRHLDSEATGSVGFVPTMGALHEGHLSLVKKAGRENDITVVSIFVNPTQFNNPDDLDKYPRDIERDISMLGKIFSGNDILFIPGYDDLYSREKKERVDLEGLDRVMEGKHRPGHFEGVVRVVKLLFETIKPTRAYFGQKDFQQLSIIRKMTAKLSMDIEIVGCPIIREESGLAMSSRNERLSPQTRKKAGIIYSTLSKYSTVKSHDDLAELKKTMVKEIERSGEFSVEYLDMVDNLSLTPVEKTRDIKPGLKYYACIAVFAGEVRLIDNVEFSFQIIKG